MKKTALFLAAALCFAACKKNLPTEIAGPIPPGAAPSPATMSLVSDMNPFTVMSFNIRITYPEDQYTQSQRKTYILQVILDNNPDIFCIQEMAEDSMETYFNTQLAAAGYGVYNTGPDNGSPKSVFYKNSRFTRTGAGWFTMHTPDYRSGKWAILQDKLTPANSYFVVNSHWTTLSSDQRNMDCDTVLNAISSNNTANLPVICVGDFNAQPGASEISKLKTGLSCVDALFDDQGDPTFHGWDAVGDAKIDWLMSTRDLAFTSSSVITTSFTVNGGTLWPSDHWPVKATYVPSVFGGAHADVNGKSANASTEFYFADVNGDGKKDKIYWNSTYDSGKPQVFLSNGNGTFTTPGIAHTAGASALTTTRHYYADVDGDGKADEILWDPTVSSGQTRVFLATGGGNFSSTAINNTEGTSQGTTTLFNFADVNGDGK
ncbi:MAG: VCBS repeat-containing protein, partial [Bacteroidetes bacterium]|nr:VCBS repeat-containing protein [Bacteroidota bacterium]